MYIYRNIASVMTVLTLFMAQNVIGKEASRRKSSINSAELIPDVYKICMII